MNQIIFNKNTSRMFGVIKIILMIVILILLVITLKWIYDDFKEKELEKISKQINTNLNLRTLYASTNEEKSKYLGRIIIDKLDIEYTVFNNYNEELLKISPCKFFGKKLIEKGNICIAAHNYNDNRFFGRLNELKEKDLIKMIDIEGREYNYIIYDKYETDDEDFSILKSNKEYELTLLTCNNSNEKRIIIKAYRK